MDKIRTFIALELPGKANQEIVRWQKKLSNKIGLEVRWTPPENIHLTLAFLGNRKPDEVKKICTVAAELASTTTPITVRPLRIKSLHHVLALCCPSKKLDTLSEKLREGLCKVDVIYQDRHSFRPHITIGRFNSQLFKRFRQKVEFPTFTLQRIAVLKSTLTNKGAKHKIIFSVIFSESEQLPQAPSQKG